MPKESDIKGSAKAIGLSGAGVGSADPGIPATRGRGRLKGMPRPPGAGRKKGTPNKVNQITRDYIIKQGAPIAFDRAPGSGVRAASASRCPAG